jgi:NADPH:quinone reductase-like Zn-dependent oxidoreductase
MDTMNAIRVAAYGGPEQLRYEPAPVPAPAPGQILVRVHATSVNPWDYKLASGAFQKMVPLQLPYTPGGEYSGVVEALGQGVTGFKVGDDIYGNCPMGAYAQFLTAPAESAAPKPRTLSHTEAATVPVAAQTAWQALLDHGHLQSGQTVLIHAAAGGVGSFAVQLAHHHGARVLATASASNADYLKGLGADEVIDYKSTPFESVAKNIDLVLDLLGGQTQTRSYSVLKPGGRLVSTVQPPTPEEAARHDVTATFIGMKASTQGLLKLKELIEARMLRTSVTQTFPLSQARQAWEAAKSGHTRGKIALTVEG